MNSINWLEVIFYVVSLGIVAGIAKQKIENLIETTSQLKVEIQGLKEDHDSLKDDHQNIKLTVVTVPTKEDMNNLTREVQNLRISITRLESILEQLASKNGINFTPHQ
jgi:FtsZ-binding cell division protein ZapB